MAKRTDIMLAKPTDTRLVGKLGPYCLVQPKINGERCRVHWMGTEPVLVSSLGNEFPFLNELKEELIRTVQFFGVLLPFDGEIYVHGWPRERIDSALRTRKSRSPDNEALEFHLFDLAEQLPQHERLVRLGHLGKIRSERIPRIRLVETLAIKTEEWMSHCVNYVSQGYEGVILRSMHANYETKRTGNMLKFKPTFLDEYTIVDFKEGTGWCQGKLGAFVVRGSLGETFAVGTGRELTAEKRKYWWSIRDSLIGRTLVVKHEELKTSGGIPLCTVAYEVK